MGSKWGLIISCSKSLLDCWGDGQVNHCDQAGVSVDYDNYR